MELLDRAKLALEYREQSYNCAQTVACVFSDVIGLPAEQIAAMTGAFGTGFGAKEICGVISGAAVVLGTKWPHSQAGDLAAKQLIGKKMFEFQAKFREKFPAMRCGELKPLPAVPEQSVLAQQLGVSNTCNVYILAAVEILEEMLA